MNGTIKNPRRKRGFIVALLVFSVFILVAPPPVGAQQAASPPEPVVAIHVSELTQALEATPGLWWPSWHYFVMPESLKEALRSDGTPYVEVSDAAIAAGGLLHTDGTPKYPILISLAAEAIDNSEIAPLLAYVNAGGILFMGSSAFTRNADGSARSDFALANELGLHLYSPNLVQNWVQTSTLTRAADHRLVGHIPAGELNWRMPLNAEEIPLGVSPGHPIHANHWVFKVTAASGTTVLANSSAGPLLATRQYGKGNFIYDGTAQPLIGHGGYDPATHSYLIYRNAIEWAFEISNVPIIKLSPWQYAYDAAFIVRHDFENDPARILLIDESAAFEHAAGAKGDYYFCTGTLRDHMTDPDKSTAIEGLVSAASNYGATIGSHNGGLPNPVNGGLSIGDFDYWHWGPDEALNVTPPGYASGQEYAKESIRLSFEDIEGWLFGVDNGRPGCGVAGTCPRSWASPYFNATREGSYEILEELGAIISSKGEQKISPFPHWTLSYTQAGKRFNHISLPLSDWFVGTSIPGALEWGHTPETMQAAVDFYHDLGGLVNLYGHIPSGNNLMGQYVTYSVSKPRMWATNAVGIADWWQERSNAAVSFTYSTSGSTASVQALITGATDPGTAIEVDISNWNNLNASDLQVFLDGALADPADYRIIRGNTVKILVGNTTSAVEVLYPIPDLPTTTGLSPVAVIPGGPAFTLTVYGTNFVSDSVVRWNGEDRTTTYVSATELTADILESDIASAGTAQITVFNPAPGGGTSNPQTFFMDGTPPTLAISAPSAAFAKSGTSVTYTVTYSGADSVTLGIGDVTLNSTDGATGTVAVTGSGTSSRTVTISNLTGNGTLGISIAAGTASDLAGNTAGSAGPSVTFIVDNIAPTMAISDGPSAPITNTGPVSYTVNYDGADIITLASGDVTLNKTGAANGTIEVSGAGNTRTVTVSGITGNGTLGIAIAAGTASDLAGNTAGAAGPSATFTVDNIAPTAAISAPSATVAKSGTIVTYMVTYTGADAVTLADADIILNKTGTANGAVAVSGSGTISRTVTISGITGDGTLGISIAAGTASDLAGNTAAAAGPSATFTVDNTAPTVTISAPSVAVAKSGTSVTYTVNYTGADSVTLGIGDVALISTGGASGTVAVTGSGTTSRTVTISNLTGNGTLGISIGAGTASDLAGNTAAAAGPSATFIVDNTAPDTSITGQPSNPTNQTSASFSFTATETGTFECRIDGGAYAACTSPKPYSGLANGSHTFNVRATDTAGNTDASPATYTWVIDTTALGMTISTTASNPTRTSPVPVTVIFSKSVTDFIDADVTFVNGNMTSGSFGGSGATYTFTVTPSGDGLVTVNIAAGVAHDVAGNANGVASLSISYDTTAPDTAITGQPANPTNQTNASFSFTATETATFECQMDGGGYSVCSSPKNYTLAAGSHTFMVRATDPAGNTDASPVVYSWMIDTTAPTVAISAPSLSVANSSVSVTYTLTYNGADTVTCAASHVTLNRTGTANGAVAVTGSGNLTRTITISNITGFDGTLGISLTAGTASDLAGNTAAGTEPSAIFTVDNASGDFNGDGVDVTDALKALRITAGLDAPTGSDSAHGDVAPLVSGQRNPDGKIDLGDTVAILRKAAGLPSW